MLRYLKPDQTLASIHRLMGWSDTVAYQRRKFSRLRLCEAAQMGMALGLEGARLGHWLLELATEEGIPPIGERFLHRPNRYAAGRRASKTCARCGGKHRRRDCPKKLGPEAQEMVARAEANPKAHRPERPRKAASE